MTPEIIALSSSEVTLGSTIILTSSGGSDVVSTSIAWSCNSHTGTCNLGSFTFTESTFESYAPTSTSMNVVFTMTSTYSDGTTGTSSATCKVNIPDKYSPTIMINSVVSAPLVNGHIRAGSSAYSKISYTVTSSGSATNTVTVTDLTCVAPVTYTISSTEVRFTLPTINSASYTLAFKLVVTDSRGRTDSVTVSAVKIGTIYCYDAPSITIESLVRSNGSVDTANGKSAHIKGSIVDNSDVYKCQIKILDTVDLELSSGNFNAIVGENKLDLGTNYTVEVSYQSVYMLENNYDPIKVTTILSAQKVPLSLLDDGNTMGVSFGEMMQDYDETTANTVINFGANSEMRGSENNKVVVMSAYDVINARNYIMQTILGGLKFKAMSKSDYQNLKNKDYDTVYFTY